MSTGAEQYVSPRADLLAMIPGTQGPYLDVGCSSGLLGESIRAGGREHVTGIEIDPERAEVATGRLDEVFTGDAGAILLDLAADGRRFGTAVLGDVLEHTADPWSVYRSVIATMEPGGHLIVSLPNVGHVSVLFGLLRGRFTYRTRGVLDRTHLRFFGLRNILEFVAGEGVVIEQVTYQYRFLDRNSRINRLAAPIGRLWRSGLTYQVAIRARVPAAG